ncbi:MAG: GTP 3',8-cyclase MoaA [Ignavibacteria bacterium]|nr:GTP 3',8-cyclase MoaA [Ignavibacteria bacterium]
MITPLYDLHGRQHSYLRVSLTDRCNLHCLYCNPRNHEVNYIPNGDLLTYDEIYRLIALFTGTFGFNKIRFTGGEPLVRNGVWDFLQSLQGLRKNSPFALGLTTNGTLLPGLVPRLLRAGVNRLNISLDSLREENFLSITGSGSFKAVLQAVQEAESAGFETLKVNCVVLRGTNDQELHAFVELTKKMRLIVQFIEFMPFSGNKWGTEGFISCNEMKDVINSIYELVPFRTDMGSDYFKVAGHVGAIRFISALSDHFCGSCNRLRLSADGKLRLCLFSSEDSLIDLKALLRSGATDTELEQKIQSSIGRKWAKHPSAETIETQYSQNMVKIGG